MSKTAKVILTILIVGVAAIYIGNDPSGAGSTIRGGFEDFFTFLAALAG